MTEFFTFVQDNTFWFLLYAGVSWLLLFFFHFVVLVAVKNDSVFIGFAAFMGLAFSTAGLYVFWIGFLLGLLIHIIKFCVAQ